MAHHVRDLRSDRRADNPRPVPGARHGREPGIRPTDMLRHVLRRTEQDEAARTRAEAAERRANDGLSRPRLPDARLRVVLDDEGDESAGPMPELEPAYLDSGEVGPRPSGSLNMSRLPQPSGAPNFSALAALLSGGAIGSRSPYLVLPRFDADMQRMLAMTASETAPTIGLPASLLQHIETFSYVAPTPPSNEGDAASPAESPTCAVCRDDIKGGEQVRRLPLCQHLYHPDCIDPWLRSHTNCPLCRKEAFSEEALLGSHADSDPAIRSFLDAIRTQREQQSAVEARRQQRLAAGSSSDESPAPMLLDMPIDGDDEQQQQQQWVVDPEDEEQGMRADYMRLPPLRLAPPPPPVLLLPPPALPSILAEALAQRPTPDSELRSSLLDFLRATAQSAAALQRS